MVTQTSVPASVRRTVRVPDRAARVAVLMLAEALSLAAASGLHLGGLVHGRNSSFRPDEAGIAEAIIGGVIAIAAVLVLRAPDRARARSIGIAANGFALAGFLVGISETSRSGAIPDITYHATVIPLLIASLVLLVRDRRP